MYQNTFFTGTVASDIRALEDGGVFFLAKSIKAFTDQSGALKAATANIIVTVPGKYGEAIGPQLKKGNRISVRGTISANEAGNPTIREDEKRGVWTAFDVKSVSVHNLGVLAEGQHQEDEFFIILAGNLGRDPEMRYIPSGDAVTNFSMATNSGHKVGAETVKETIWWRVTAWRKQAETANEYLHKGSRVLVEGALIFDPETGGPRLWERNDGGMGSSFEITMFTYKLLDKKGDGPAPAFQGSAEGAGFDFPDADDGGEIPF
jgi:single-strand DNA-binding protein